MTRSPKCHFSTRQPSSKPLPLLLGRGPTATAPAQDQKFHCESERGLSFSRSNSSKSLRASGSADSRTAKGVGLFDRPGVRIVVVELGRCLLSNSMSWGSCRGHGATASVVIVASRFSAFRSPTGRPASTCRTDGCRSSTSKSGTRQEQTAEVSRPCLVELLESVVGGPGCAVVRYGVTQGSER